MHFVNNKEHRSYFRRYPSCSLFERPPSLGCSRLLSSTFDASSGSGPCDVIVERQKQQQTETAEKMADVVNVGVNLDAFSHAISGIQALRSSVSRVFESLKDGMKNRETLEGREKQFIAEFQDNLQAVNRDLK